MLKSLQYQILKIQLDSSSKSVENGIYVVEAVGQARPSHPPPPHPRRVGSQSKRRGEAKAYVLQIPQPQIQGKTSMRAAGSPCLTGYAIT